MDSESVARRLRAARALEDLTVEQLAARIAAPGLGAKTLGAIERGTRSMRPQERGPITEALRVPADFFTADSVWDPRPAASGAPSGLVDVLALVEQVRAQIDGLSRQADANLNQAVDYRTETTGKLLGLLEQQATRLERIERRLEELMPLDDTAVVPLVRRALASVADEARELATPPSSPPRPHQGSKRATNRPATGPDPNGPQR